MFLIFLQGRGFGWNNCRSLMYKPLKIVNNIIVLSIITRSNIIKSTFEDFILLYKISQIQGIPGASPGPNRGPKVAPDTLPKTGIPSNFP